MSETLELPTGETVTPEDVFLYNGYPSRFVPADDEEYAFLVAPLYWGGSGMDVPFRDREAFYDQWGPDSGGTRTAEEWRAWLREARADDRFGEEEVDALARTLLPGGTTPGRDVGPLARLRRVLGL